MPVMRIILDGDNAWPDLMDKPVIHTTEEIGVTALAGGMESGLPSVAFRITLPDGQTVVAETSLALFLTAGDAFKDRYGDPRESL